MYKKFIFLSFCLTAVLTIPGCGPRIEKDAAIRVNGTILTKSQVMRIAEVIREQYVRIQPQLSIQGLSSDIIKGAAHQLIANEVMLKEARRRGLKADTARVNRAIDQFRKKAGDQAAFQRQLTSMGETEESVKRQMSEGIMLDSLLRQILSGVDSVTVEECKAFYEKNKKEYVDPPSSRIRQMFFPLDTTANQQVRQTVLQNAKNALDEAKKGKDFGTVVKKYASSKATESDMGWFKRGDMRPDLERTIEGLKVGDLSDIVTTPTGYLIFKKTEEKAGAPMTFEKMRNNIKATLEIQKRNSIVVAYVDSLIARAAIEYIDTSFRPVPKLSGIPKP